MARKLGDISQKALEIAAEMARRSIAYQKETFKEDFEDMVELLFFGPYEKARRDRRKIPTKREMYQAHLRLKANRYITYSRGRPMRITDKGKIALLENKIRNKHKNPWDGKWRVFVFDVREDARHERNFLRSYLKGFGAKELQKSVWITPCDIEEDLNEFLRLLNKKIEGDVRILTVYKISPDSDLRGRFDL